jgi:RNA polymerase sigma factor (sigma-70 family)
MMPLTNQGRTTDPKLLELVRDWRNGQAWPRFVEHYEPHLRAVCRRYGLVGEAADDCCQQVWIKLAARMRTFRYDPGQRFRGWLHRFFQGRVKDFLKAAKAHPFDQRQAGDEPFDWLDLAHDDGEPCDPEVLAMLRRAEEIQDAVRGRVKPDNWEVYRLIAIDSWSTEETAAFLGRKYAAVYRACQRVSRMLRDEGCKR